jgi:sodium transport system permease protein
VLIYAVLVPLVIYPVMFIGANDLVFWVLGQVEKQKARVAIEHVQDAARYELVVAAVKNTKEAQIVEPPDAMAALRAGEIDAYVTFEPPKTVAVNVLQSNLIDKTASKVMGAIYSEHYERERNAIKKAGLTHHDLEVFDVSIVDIAPSASKGEIVPVRDLGGVPLPLLILFAFVWLHIAVGMGPPATVMFAEQREKRTIETTFLEPVARNALVGAKFFTTWLIGMFAGAMYAIGIALTVGTLIAVVSVRTAEKMGYRQGNLLALLSALKLQGVAAESWMLLAHPARPPSNRRKR